MRLSRRGFLASGVAAASAHALPQIAKPAGRRVLTLVFDKALGMMRAVERIVP